jgi:tetratricopeptide (TPR) repeat protein
LDEPADVTPRPLDALRAETHRVDQAVQASDYAAAAALLPELLTELQALAARGRSSEWPEALALLVVAGQAAFYTVKDLGNPDLGYVAAERVVEAAARAEDVTGLALGDFLRAHALLPIGGYARALAATDRAADALRPHAEGSALEVYGMLDLTAALTLVSVGRHDDAEARVAEAADVAARTEGTNAYGLAFSPANVAVWQIAMAVERGEGGRAVEIARAVDVSGLPRGRQAAFWTDTGRGLAQIRRDEQALVALRRAEDIAPQQLRTNPMVRDVVGGMVRRARAAAGGPELVGFAHRLGVA